MQPIINVHSHLINFDFFPDNYFRIRSPLREWMLKQPLTSWIVRFITHIIPGKDYNKMHEMQAILRMEIEDVAKELIKEMDEANVVMTTPLMMDLEISSFNEKAETPYSYQVILISEIAERFPGRFMPFIMYDPRRPSAFKLIKRALEEMGYLGVKFYPSLGYHPDPKSYFNEVDTNEELEKIYAYCESEQVPITAHCSPGGSFSGEFLHHKDLIRRLTRPSNWENVLKKHPKLRLNISHFGGSFLRIHEESGWAHKINELISKYENAYSDIAYQSEAFRKKTHEKYFRLLTELLESQQIGNKIIFGTDWSSTRHTWTENDYLKPFRKHLSAGALKKLGFDNPLEFLFPGKKLPARISDFYSSKGIKSDSYPAWMKQNLV